MPGAEPEPRRVVALAGRRVDPPGAEIPRFPLEHVPQVRARIRSWLASAPTEALVSSAACGADLLGLEVAEELGIRTRVVLPFAPERFRESSVTDRPGDWGGRFDRIVDTTRRRGDLVVLPAAGEGSRAYAGANEEIIAQATQLAEVCACRKEAAIVWDGRSRGADDVTEAFARLARAGGFTVTELPTGDSTLPSGTHPMI